MLEIPDDPIEIRDTKQYRNATDVLATHIRYLPVEGYRNCEPYIKPLFQSARGNNVTPCLETNPKREVKGETTIYVERAMRLKFNNTEGGFHIPALHYSATLNPILVASGLLKLTTGEMVVVTDFIFANRKAGLELQFQNSLRTGGDLIQIQERLENLEEAYRRIMQEILRGTRSRIG